MDVEDGDALTGEEERDECYRKAAESLRDQKPDEALSSLLAALEVSQDEESTDTLDIIQAVFTFLGSSHELTLEYQAKLPPQSIPAAAGE